ncbi:Maf-like protein [Lutibacter citreus]|uniref:Maf-like protein n=1 Tax=Lutibacter citreus TaxID=2138210 RepID=UPI000DBE080A|nr:Maf-like protein [Lutibacter citreus]
MLSKKLKNKNIILASGSPRRQELLKELDINFIIKVKEINEVYNSSLKEEQITNFLALEKAKLFKTNLKENDIVITSDTIVWLENSALEKPKNKVEAIKMLSKLSGKTHKVITSVCLLSKDKEKIFFDTTKVTFKNLSNEEIEYYVKKYKPFDKAGAYGVQEWIGYIGVTKLEGSYFNVMGLPVHKVYEELLNF